MTDRCSTCGSDKRDTYAAPCMIGSDKTPYNADPFHDAPTPAVPPEEDAGDPCEDCDPYLTPLKCNGGTTEENPRPIDSPAPQTDARVTTATAATPAAGPMYFQVRYYCEKCGVELDPLANVLPALSTPPREVELLARIFHECEPPVVVTEQVQSPAGRMAGFADIENHRILISPNLEESDTRRCDVLLHEAAHILAGEGAHHNDRFWCILRALALAYGDAESVENTSRDEWECSWEHFGESE